MALLKGVSVLYTKDKNKQIVVRLSDSQHTFLQLMAESQGCNVSELVRHFIDYFLVLWGNDK